IGHGAPRLRVAYQAGHGDLEQFTPRILDGEDDGPLARRRSGRRRLGAHAGDQRGRSANNRERAEAGRSTGHGHSSFVFLKIKHTPSPVTASFTVGPPGEIFSLVGGSNCLIRAKASSSVVS